MPVPTSTTARASSIAARKRRAAPAPGPIGTQPTSSARRRRVEQHLVLGDGTAPRTSSSDSGFRARGPSVRGNFPSVEARRGAVRPGRLAPTRTGETMDAVLLMVGGAVDERARPDGDPVESTSAVPVRVPGSVRRFRPRSSRVPRPRPARLLGLRRRGRPGRSRRALAAALVGARSSPTHGDRVYRLAYRLTGNKHDAEDLTQEVFVRVFRSLSTYTPGNFEGWLHRITTNLFLDQVRRKQPDPLRRAGRGRRRPARGPRAPPEQVVSTGAWRRRPGGARRAARRNSARPSCCATSRA